MYNLVGGDKTNEAKLNRVREQRMMGGWKQPKCPSTDEWIKKLLCTHTHTHTHTHTQWNTTQP